MLSAVRPSKKGAAYDTAHAEHSAALMEPNSRPAPTLAAYNALLRSSTFAFARDKLCTEKGPARVSGLAFTADHPAASRCTRPRPLTVGFRREPSRTLACCPVQRWEHVEPSPRVHCAFRELRAPRRLRAHRVAEPGSG